MKKYEAPLFEEIKIDYPPYMLEVTTSSVSGDNFQAGESADNLGEEY